MFQKIHTYFDWMVTARSWCLCQKYVLSVIHDCASCVQAEEIEAWEGLPASIKEEVGSPYGFLCENARYLVVPQAMRGHPKLWHVQGNIVKGVSPALRPAKPVGAQPFSWHQVRPCNQ